MSSASSNHANGRAQTGHAVVLDRTEAEKAIQAAAATNADVNLARNHPGADKAATPFVGLAILGVGSDFVRYEYAPRPLGEEDIEIDVEFCGICGSDLHTMTSGWGAAKYPVIVGHEIVGKVARVGSAVKHLKVGDRAGVGAEVLSCRHCQDCKNKDDAYCAEKVFTYNSKYADGQWAYGGYANKVRVHSEWAFAIPNEISLPEAAPLLCAGVTVFAPLQRFVKPGQSVGVVGIGGLGHLGIQFAHKLGAKVTAISTSLRKKDDAQKFGASSFIVSTDAAAVKAAHRSFDLILITANPDNCSLDPYITMLKIGGRAVIVGAPETPFNFSGYEVLSSRTSITGSLIGSRHEVAEALQFAAKHGVRPVVEVLPISQANVGVKKVHNNDVRYRVVLQMPIA